MGTKILDVMGLVPYKNLNAKMIYFLKFHPKRLIPAYFIYNMQYGNIS